MMTQLIGQTFGRYQITEQLGQGGMACVYKALDMHTERKVALKVILPNRVYEVELAKRFDREARALASLSHPNIVRISDFGKQDGIPYLVMDFIAGGALKQKVGAPLPWFEAARLLAPIARALEYAHDRGIIHRDIKPANILITESGEPMLSDFGIAKILEGQETSSLTGTGVGIGTPEYMAPEQVTGAVLDARADIYSLGVVFYELVTGKKPFQADTPMAVAIKQAIEPVPPPRKYIPDLPEKVEQIIYKALAKQPENRYQRMSDFAQVLERLAAEGVISRGREPQVYRARRIPTGIWIAAVAVVGLALLGAGVALVARSVIPFLISRLEAPTRIAAAAASQTTIVVSTQTPAPTGTSTAVITPTELTPSMQLTIDQAAAIKSDTPAPDTVTPEAAIEATIKVMTYLRMGPAANHPAVKPFKYLNVGEKVFIIRKVEDDQWFIARTSEGKEGWLYYLWIEDNFDRRIIPTVSITPTPIPVIPTGTLAPNQPQPSIPSPAPPNGGYP